MARIYEIADQLRIPGVKVDAALYPSTLTKRIFNSARSMIESGVIIGHGGAAKVAKYVFSGRNVTHLRTTTYGILRYGHINLPREAREEIVECYEAFIMLKKAQYTDPHEPSTLLVKDRYWDDRREDVRTFFENLPNSRWIGVDQPELRNRIAGICAAHRTDLTKQNTADLLKQFDAGEPFPINVFESPSI